MIELNYEIALLVCCLAILISGFLVHIFYTSKLKLMLQKEANLLTSNDLLQAELTQEKKLLNESNERNNQLFQESAIVKSDLRHLRIKYEQQSQDTEAQEEKFENIANRVLRKQSSNFNEQQTKGIKQILEPLKDRINVFEQRVERSNNESLKRHESLKEQIKFLSAKSDKISQDANNLTKALKGDFKQQGNWGELILNSILDKSGLEKDREYFVQTTRRDSNGKIQKPDVVIHLPDGKRLIIDSKVSLVAYDALVNADNESAFKSHQKAHAFAIKKHIDDLSGKNYHNLYKMESPDFVLMFIPIDTAFGVALKYNSELYNYAFDKNIVVVTPSTLLASLKTVETMWRNDKYNHNAMEIADEAGKMYDKFVGFIDDMEKIGKQLHTVQHSYQDSMKKLHTGSGNLVRKAEKIRALGAKANKRVKKPLVQLAVE